MQAARQSDMGLKATRFWIELGKVHVELEDGREGAVPVSWYPRLSNAKEHDLYTYRILGGGRLISWPLLEEALAVETIINGTRGSQPSIESLAPRAHRVKNLRLKAKLTQVQLAQMLGCSQALVSMAEKGKVWVGSDWEERVIAACTDHPQMELTHPVGSRG